MYLETLFNRLRMCLYRFVFLPLMHESSCGSAAWPAFGAISVLDLSPSDRRVVVSHCIDLHFPDVT